MGNRFSALLAEVARGVEVIITKRGVPVAKLVPATPGFDREKARRAAAGLREASRGVTLEGIRIEGPGGRRPAVILATSGTRQRLRVLRLRPTPLA